MLTNLYNAALLWFETELMNADWSKYLWLAFMGLGVLFLLIIFVLFFKAIRRSRERKLERQIRSEVAAETKSEKSSKKEKKSKKEAAATTVADATPQQQQQQPIVVVAAQESKPEEKPVERLLTGITLDVGVVQRDFKTGDEFNCDGLLVFAHYNVEPMQETIANYTVVTSEVFDQVAYQGNPNCLVSKPDMSRAGKMSVRVCMNKQFALYTISVTEHAAEEKKEEAQPQPVVAPVAEEPKKEEPQKVERVVTGITLDVGVVQRDFKVGDAFNCDGLIVNANFNLAPMQEAIADYTVVDAGAFAQVTNVGAAGVYVCQPDLSRAGKIVVRVALNKQIALYTISVTEPVVEQPKQPEPQVQPVYAQPQQQPVQQQATGPREMISLTVNADYARRDFYVGDTLTHDGIVVNAHFNREPFKEQVYNYTVITPDMSRAGNPSVVIMYQDRATSYPITVRPNPYAQQQQQPYAQPYAQQQPQQQQAAPQKERVLTFVSVNSDFAKKDYYVGEAFSREGLMVTAHYNVEPTQEQVTNFTVIPPDMTREGNAMVMVAYQDRMVSYPIVIRPNPFGAKSVEAEQPKAVERVVKSISLDLGVVQREFNAGDDFDCDGLVINANYNVEPMQETVADFVVVDAKTFEQFIHQPKPVGCYVCRPQMDVAGKKVVRVSLDKQIALYTISVHEAAKQPEPQPVVVAEPVVEEKPQPKVEREVKSITLDLGVVTREFEQGADFECEGLLINAHYNVEPLQETVADFTVVDANSFDQIIHQAKGSFVCEPKMDEVGKKVVRVALDGQIAVYTISIQAAAKQPEPQPEPQPQVVFVEQEPQVIEKVVEKLVEPDRALLYITLSTDNVQKEFVLGDNLNAAGLVVNAHFNREPYMEQVTSFTVTAPDMSSVGTYTVGVHYQDKTVGYQISVVNPPVVEEKPEPQAEPAAVQPVRVDSTPIVVEEESYEGRLRYDRSFQARIIQSDDKTKYWYTDIKNELCSYKKVHARISWKRETFKCGKNVVAKLAYRGNTLCLLLPLNPRDYADTKYALEDVSDTPSNVDTPAMLRLKSDKRVKQAMELIEEVMDELNIDKDKKYEAQDFYVPYEGVFELIKKGLIKREIKTAQDEAVFTGGVADDEDDAYELNEVAPGVFVSPKK